MAKPAATMTMVMGLASLGVVAALVGGTPALASSPRAGNFISRPAAVTGFLYGVDAVSKKDVWAVGESQGQALIGHFDGTAWNRVASPAIGGVLLGVSADSASDVWAVGRDAVGRSVIEHWNGSAWAAMPPATAAIKALGGLGDVSAVSASDVWAVGGGSVVHWDGNRWTRVPTPDPPEGDDSFSGISADVANDAWLAGRYTYGSSGCNHNLIEHWDGTAWTIVPTGDVGSCALPYSYHPYGSYDPYGDWLDDVAAVSPTVAYAVGAYDAWDGDRYNHHSLLGSWDGTQWHLSGGPRFPGWDVEFLGVDAMASSDVWAVGWESSNALAAHYAGSWSTTQFADDEYANLGDVSAISKSNVWAVGGKNGEVMLIEHWNGTSWTQETMTE